jgi:hypothetical protein
VLCNEVICLYLDSQLIGVSLAIIAEIEITRGKSPRDFTGGWFALLQHLHRLSGIVIERVILSSFCGSRAAVILS